MFELYAQENNFDPMDPSNWYSPKAISFVKVLSPLFFCSFFFFSFVFSSIVNFVKGLLIVKTFYQGSAAKALADLFPNMTLDESRFHTFGTALLSSILFFFF